MRTSKAISTISYNTPEFLKTTLDELLSRGIITYYMYIFHLPEEDEKKKHCHLYLKPNSLIDTWELGKQFIEPDPNKPNKPFKCLDWHSSKINEWILYNCHFKPYLDSLPETRKYYYTKDDFFFSDEDDFDDKWNTAFKGSDFAHQKQIVNMLTDKGFKPSEIVDMGCVPLKTVSDVSHYFRLKEIDGRISYDNNSSPCLSGDVTYRGNHKGHD